MPASMRISQEPHAYWVPPQLVSRTIAVEPIAITAAPR